jgi:cytochrome c553
MRPWPILPLLLAFAATALAQDAARPYGLRPLWPTPEATTAVSADPRAGRAVATGGERRAGWACTQCHGLEGAADGSGGFPRLAGQHAWYLYKQLQDYASGARPNEVMTPVARGLTDGERRDVAAWYAAQENAPLPPTPQADLAVLQRGGAIHATGAPARGVTACSNCHGLQGQGAGPSIPALAGQYAPYIALQLREWKTGERRNGPLGVMAQVAAGMTEEEIEAIALYYATLRPGRGPAQAAR